MPFFIFLIFSGLCEISSLSHFFLFLVICIQIASVVINIQYF